MSSTDSVKSSVPVPQQTPPREQQSPPQSLGDLANRGVETDTTPNPRTSRQQKPLIGDQPSPRQTSLERQPAAEPQQIKDRSATNSAADKKPLKGFARLKLGKSEKRKVKTDPTFRELEEMTNRRKENYTHYASQWSSSAKRQVYFAHMARVNRIIESHDKDEELGPVPILTALMTLRQIDGIMEKEGTPVGAVMRAQGAPSKAVASAEEAVSDGRKIKKTPFDKNQIRASGLPIDDIVKTEEARLQTVKRAQRAQKQKGHDIADFVRRLEKRNSTNPTNPKNHRGSNTMSSIEPTPTQSPLAPASLTTESKTGEEHLDSLENRSGTPETPSRGRLGSSALTSNKNLSSEYRVATPPADNKQGDKVQAKSITNRRARNVDKNQVPLKGFARFKERVRNFFNRLFRGSQWRMVVQKKRLLKLVAQNLKVYDKHLERLTPEQRDKYLELRGEFDKILMRCNDARINFTIKALEGKEITESDQLIMDTLPQREIDEIRLQLTIVAGLFLFLYEPLEASQENQEQSQTPPLLSDAGKQAGLQDPHKPLNLLEATQQEFNVEQVADQTDKQD